MGPGLLLFAFLLFVVAMALLWLARRGRAASGVPRGRVVYVDSEDWERSPALRAPRYDLVGRPDYLLREGKTVIPVEAKPSREAEDPYEADVLQLAAYCLLVEETYGVTPPYGLLVYRHHTFEVPFDEATREQLLDILDEMHDVRHHDDVLRSHEQPARCAACSMRGHCGEEALR